MRFCTVLSCPSGVWVGVLNVNVQSVCLDFLLEEDELVKIKCILRKTIEGY